MTSEDQQRIPNATSVVLSGGMVDQNDGHARSNCATSLVERKRRFSESNVSKAVGNFHSKSSRYSDDDQSEVVLRIESNVKATEVETDVAHHIELKPSDDEESDMTEEEDGADGEPGELAAEQRVYPCPMTSSGGRPRKHPAQPPKYLCQYCGRGCQKPSVLAKHIRAHTNERPYPCDLCGFAFKTKSNLYKHSKSKTHLDKLNSVLQAKRLSTLTDSASVHVTTDIRSADSGSPVSDQQLLRHDSPFCTPTHTPELAEAPSRGVKNEALGAATDDSCHSVDLLTVPHSDTTSHSNVNTQITCGTLEALAPLKRPVDTNFAVKAKLRSHIEQKQSSVKSAQQDEPVSPRTTLTAAPSVVSVSICDAVSMVTSTQQCSSESPIESRVTNGNSASPIAEEAQDNRQDVTSSKSVLTDSTAGDGRQVRPGKSSMQLVLRDHNMPTLQSALCSTWCLFKKPPICSLLHKALDEDSNKQSSECNGENTASVLPATSQSDSSQSRIDVLIEASDMVNTSSCSFVLSSLELLAEAAEAASKSDKDQRHSRVPSPAEHVDIVNVNKSQASCSSAVTQLLAEPRKYMCHLCSKPFPKEHTLLLHLKVHAIEAPFRCGVCRVSYGKLSRLKRHQIAKGHHAPPCTTGNSSSSQLSLSQSQSARKTDHDPVAAVSKANNHSAESATTAASAKADTMANASRTDVLVNQRTNSGESLGTTIPIGAISTSFAPFATSSCETTVAQSMDPRFVFLGGPAMGLSNGQFIAAFMPFNGYTLVPAPGGLYLAAQAQSALNLNALSSNAQVLLPSGNQALQLSNHAVAHNDGNCHNNEQLLKVHASASVSESNSDKDNAEYDGACAASRPFRCETCKRGFRVQGHLNKHMRSKIHLDNVANIEAKS